MAAYYNDSDPNSAHWLRSLIAAGLIPAGVVDERSICEVQPDDLRRFVQVHLFAGIGGWAYALSLAEWPEDAPVWTGSCPCQPFSAAGKRLGEADERHLWPEMCRLVQECQPATIFGEQVASPDGLEWLARVRADLEAAGYAFGAADLPAASVGAPHRRQRLFWVADSDGGGRFATRQPRGLHEVRGAAAMERGAASQPSPDCGVADSDGRDAGAEGLQRGWQHGQRATDGGVGLGMADTAGQQGATAATAARQAGPPRQPRGVGGADFWGSTTIPCNDGKPRRLEPGLEPLVDGIPSRVAQLRGLGNAIVPQVAAEFVRAYMETLQPGGETA